MNILKQFEQFTAEIITSFFKSVTTRKAKAFDNNTQDLTKKPGDYTVNENLKRDYSTNPDLI